MNKTICMIIPPSVFLLDERVFVSLGILRVAAALEKSGVRIELIDLSGIQNYEEVVKTYIQSSSTQIFAITSTTPQMPAVYKISQAIRQSSSSAKIILGGPHITLVHCAYKKEVQHHIVGRAHSAFQKCADTFDVLIAGDGEEAIHIAIREDSPKLIDADNPKSELFLTSEKLNHIPLPARHLIDMKSYHYSIDGIPATSLIAQLGCPFSCGFCGGRESPSLRRVRMRSSENVVSEIMHLYQTYGFRGFMFYDDELNVNPKLIELMHLIRDTQKKIGVEFRLRGFLKSELFNDEQAKAMYEAGFRWILVGFESGSSRILKNMNKKAAKEDNTRCVEIAHRHGLKVKALMSVGHPGESEKTIMESRDWLLEVHPEDFDVSIITSYPGTPYYDEAIKDSKNNNVWVYSAKENGDKLYSYELDYTQVADYYKGDPNGGYRSYVYTDYLKAEELVKLRDFVERDVREKLHIPFNPSGTSIRYEHSMGQAGSDLPSNILRKSNL